MSIRWDARPTSPGRAIVHAAGFNAFGQLLNNLNDNDVAFHELRLPNKDSRVIFSGWSTTVIQYRSHIYSYGYQSWEQVLPDNSGNFHCAFGDHNGLGGVLDQHGHLYVVEDEGSNRRLVRARGLEMGCPHSLVHIAMAGNGRISAAMQGQNDRHNVSRVIQFDSLSLFLSWYRDLRGDFESPAQCDEVPGSVVQLIANTAGFVLLMQGGQVYSWGDPRHQSLARSVADGKCTPADHPGEIEALGGLFITKISAGGWLAAALSEDGALYLWGASTPGRDGQLDMLRGLEPDELALVVLPNAEDQDILDFSVGENHIVVVIRGGHVFVAGENKDGQLGSSTSNAFCPDWVRIQQFDRARAVMCGPKCSFVWA
jgi:alpha-tubulin suppressor-like RCC1 family protein